MIERGVLLFWGIYLKRTLSEEVPDQAATAPAPVPVDPSVVAEGFELGLVEVLNVVACVAILSVIIVACRHRLANRC